MKKIFLAGLVGILLSFNADAAQVNSSEYIREHSQYGRSDGPHQRRDSDGFDWFINGQRQVSVGKTVYEDFSEYGDADDWCMQSDWTGCSGTAGEVDLVRFPSGNNLACQMMGTQSILGAVDMDAGYLDISGDQTNDDGVECAWGVHGASGGTFTVGKDPAFFSCLQVAITNVSGTDDFHFGFRVADDLDGDTGGFNQTFDDYHDLVAWSIIAAADPADVNISTIAADGGTSETDTTVNWEDGDRFDLCVFISDAGVATFYYDNAATAAESFSDLKAPPTTTTYTFTDAESIIPFFHLLQGSSTQTGAIPAYEWVTGYGTFPLDTAGN